MSTEPNIATECNNLDGLFQQVVVDLKGSFVIWDDLTVKATKLHGSLKSTLYATNAFLETFQKIADMALGARGAASELGSALTRLCLRQRTIEDKLKTFTNTLISLISVPLQERLEEWRRNVVQLDKVHAKETKRVRQDVRKAYSETMRWKKKAKKGKPDVIRQLEISLADYNNKYAALEALERSAVRSVLLEERSHFCFLVRCLKPVMECECEMLAELTHVKEIMDTLHTQAAEPFVLSANNERVILDRSRLSAENRSSVPASALARNSPHFSHGSRKSSQSSASSNSCLQSPSHQCSQTWSTPKCRKSADPSIQYSCASTNSTLQSESGVCTMDVSSMASDLTMNLYAVPNRNAESVSGETFGNGNANDELLYFRSVSEPGTSTMNYCTCGQSSIGCMALPEVPLPPLGGYVNMNQLACFAVQQQEICQKNASYDDVKKSAEAGSSCCDTTARGNLSNTLTSRQSISSLPAVTSQQVTPTSVGQASKACGEKELFGNQGSPSGQSSAPVHSASERAFTDSNTTVLHSSTSANTSPTLPTPVDMNCLDFVDMLPLPPSPHLLAGVDDVDNLPLPPPPLELCPGYSYQQSPDLCADLQPIPPMSSHASRRDMLRNLSSVESGRPGSNNDSAVMRRAVSARRASEISHFGFANRTPTKSKTGDDGGVNCNFDESLVETLKKGVKLKKTASRDRSAPRLPIQRS